MDTPFHFLDELESDLLRAARRERATRREGAPHDPAAPRRRRVHLGAIAASFVALLVVAGAIGFLAGGGRDAEQSLEIAGGSADTGSAPGAATPVTDPDHAIKGAPDGLSYDSFENAPGAATTREEGTGAANATGTATDLSKIVRDGTITVIVPKDDFDTAFATTSGVAESLGGFVLSSSIRDERAGTLTLRIPAKKLDNAILRIRELGRVAEQSVTGKDVTAEFVDLKARLDVLKTRRSLIVKLLGQSTSVNEQLQLQREFDDVQLQIEQIQGSLNVLNDQVSLATLKVSLREEGAPPASQTEADVTNPSLASAWDHAVAGFLSVVSAVVVGLGYLLPILAIGGAAYGIAVMVRRRRRAAS